MIQKGRRRSLFSNPILYLVNLPGSFLPWFRNGWWKKVETLKLVELTYETSSGTVCFYQHRPNLFPVEVLSNKCLNGKKQKDGPQNSHFCGKSHRKIIFKKQTNKRLILTLQFGLNPLRNIEITKESYSNNVDDVINFFLNLKNSYQIV